MRSVIVIVCLLIPNICSASSDVLENTFGWLQAWAPDNIEFKVDKSAIKFNGCKQKEYSALLHQPLSDNFIFEMGLGYAKGRHSWGVFNQKISVKEISFIPRYQLSHGISLGMGLIAQSQAEFSTTQGAEFNLPKNTEWLINTRVDGFAQNHYWEWTASSQKWRASDDFGELFENGATDNKIALSYNGYF